MGSFLPSFLLSRPAPLPLLLPLASLSSPFFLSLRWMNGWKKTNHIFQQSHGYRALALSEARPILVNSRRLYGRTLLWTSILTHFGPAPAILCLLNSNSFSCPIGARCASRLLPSSLPLLGVQGGNLRPLRPLSNRSGTVEATKPL